MSRKIVVRPAVLMREYLPKRLLHREEELRQLKDNIGNGVNTIMFGRVGAGKTALSRRVIEDLATEDVRYVDCTLYGTSYSVLREIVPSARLSFQRSIYQLMKKLAKEASEKRVWICFDNFVRLKDPGIVTKVMSAGVNVVLVSNVKRNAEVLNLNALSYVPCTVKLSDYTTKQSFDILKERAQEALAKSSYTDEVLTEISERAEGNMTLAIGVLRTAALKAEGESKRRIETTDLVGTLSLPTTQGNLGDDEKTLLEILKEKKRLSSGQLFLLYTQRAASSKSERSFRNYLENLCKKGLVKAMGEKRGRAYEIVDHKCAR